MAAPDFPLNPANNQTYVFNNIEYTYFSNKNYWKTSKVQTNYNVTTVTATTNSLSTESYDIKKINGYQNYIITDVVVDNPCWLVMYSSNTSMMSDLNRGINDDPSSNSGVLLEVISDFANSYSIVPRIYAANKDSPISNTIYLKITNLSQSTTTVSANITIMEFGA